MGATHKQKQIFGWLMTAVACLTLLVILFVVLPLLPAEASTDSEYGKTIEHDRGQINENLGIGDEIDHENDHSTDNTQGQPKPDHGDTTPTDPPPPEPIESTPTNPDQPETPTELPTFMLTQATLPNTVWDYDTRQWQLKFYNKTYKLFDRSTANAGSDGVIIESGKWEITGNTLALTPKTQSNGWLYEYSNHTLTERDYGYRFTLTTRMVATAATIAETGEQNF